MTRNDSKNFDRLELLETFLRIKDAGSLSAAARQLGLSQPTVSRRLQALEKYLGLRLIRRTTHKLQLTEEGHQFSVKARELIENWNRMESDLKGVRDEPIGLLRVQVPHALGQDQLMPLLSEYLTLYPQVSIEWQLTDRSPDFVGSDIDCAVVVGSVHDPSVVALKIAEIPRIVVGSREFVKGLDRVQDPKDLSKISWIALTTFYRDTVNLYRIGSEKKVSIRIRPRLLTESLYVVRKAALLGQGLCLSSAWIVKEDLKAKRLLHLLPEWQGEPLPVYLIYPENRYQPTKLVRFLELVRSQKSKLLAEFRS